MIPTTLGDVAAVTGGRLAAPDATVTGIAIDSRDVVPGALFVALPGEHVDGHDFADDAVARGAVAVLAQRDVGVAAVVVADVVVALGRLARATCDRLAAPVVGITGSSGKTTTKDMVADLLAPYGGTVAPQGSHNNEIGLPLTVLSADAGTRWLVLEYSTRGAGQIRALCEVAPPAVGVVLNAGTAHLGEFGSREAIARAKAELVQALPAGGLAVLNAEDPAVSAMAATTFARVVRFGTGGDYRAEGVRLDGGRARFRLVTAGGMDDVALRYAGEHQVRNALAAAAVAEWAGLPVDVIAAGLSAAQPRSRWRMEVHERADGVTVVNDAYNANPDSVRAALKTLAALGRHRAGGRVWAVLGEMAELGDESWALHDEIGRLCVRLDVDRLVVVGPGAKGIHAGAALEGSWEDEAVYAEDVDAAVAMVRAGLRPGDVVLVKGSRVAGLERVAEALLAEAPLAEAQLGEVPR